MTTLVTNIAHLCYYKLTKWDTKEDKSNSVTHVLMMCLKYINKKGIQSIKSTEIREMNDSILGWIQKGVFGGLEIPPFRFDLKQKL